LVNDFYSSIELRSRFWPLIVICIGVLIVFRSRTGRRSRHDTQLTDENVSKEDMAEVTTFFGSSQKTITSRQFASGDITCIFGGAELDLTHADIQGEATLDVTTIFGGVELIIPAHWTVKSDVVSVFGSVRDKREQPAMSAQDPEKVIRLDGTALFGGIEIRSFKNK
jgi:predicted membrane protein